MYEKLIGYFLGERESRSLDEYYRARIMVVLALSASVLLIPFLVTRVSLQGISHPYSLTLIGTIGVLVATPFLFRWTQRVDISGGTMMILCTISTISLCLFDGGAWSSGISWVPLMPLFGIFFAGIRIGFVIVGLLVASFTLTYLITGNTYFEESPLPPALVQQITIGSIVAVSFLLVLTARLFLQWQAHARRALEDANQVKDQFLSGVSHELRTPLNSILGFAEILNRGYAGELSGEQQKQLGYISSSGEHLLGIVDDLLHITHIETGQFRVSLAPINPSATLSDVRDALANAATDKQIELRAVTPQNDINLLTDDQRLRQILINLASNAIKFTPAGGTVTITLQTKDGHAEFLVDDTGDGISDDDQQRIFDKFYQVNRSLSDKPEGTGMGLFLSRSIAETLGGSLTLQQSTAAGSSFRLALPMRDAQPVSA